MQFWHHVTSDNKETTHEGVTYEQHKGTNFHPKMFTYNIDFDEVVAQWGFVIIVP